MPSEDPSLAELINLGTDTALARVHKATPGIVRAYDPVTNWIIVKPALKQARYGVDDDERSFIEFPEIPNVPVVWPRFGGFVLRGPIAPGDSVLLVYCDASLAEWRETGGVTEPQDARLHSCGWAVAIPGLFPDTTLLSPLDAVHALTQAIFGQDGGSQLRIGPTGIELAPSGVIPPLPIALAPPILTTQAALLACHTAMVTVLANLLPAATAPAAAQITAYSAAVTAAGVAVALAAATTPSTLVRSV